MCIPTFVGFFLFHLFFSLFLSFSFSFLCLALLRVLKAFFFLLFPFVFQPLNSPLPDQFQFFFHQVFFFLWSTAPFVNVTPSRPPTHVNFLLTMSLLTPAGDQLVAEGITHISLPTQEYDRGNGENRRTTNNKAWG